MGRWGLGSSTRPDSFIALLGYMHVLFHLPYRQLKTLYAVAKKLGVHAQQVKRIVERMERKRRMGEGVRRIEKRISAIDERMSHLEAEIARVEGSLNQLFRSLAF